MFQQLGVGQSLCWRPILAALWQLGAVEHDVWVVVVPPCMLDALWRGSAYEELCALFGVHLLGPALCGWVHPYVLQLFGHMYASYSMRGLYAVLR